MRLPMLAAAGLLLLAGCAPQPAARPSPSPAPPADPCHRAATLAAGPLRDAADAIMAMPAEGDAPGAAEALAALTAARDRLTGPDVTQAIEQCQERGGPGGDALAGGVLSVRLATDAGGGHGGDPVLPALAGHLRAVRAALAAAEAG